MLNIRSLNSKPFLEKNVKFLGFLLAPKVLILESEFIGFPHNSCKENKSRESISELLFVASLLRNNKDACLVEYIFSLMSFLLVDRNSNHPFGRGSNIPLT